MFHGTEKEKIKTNDWNVSDEMRTTSTRPEMRSLPRGSVYLFAIAMFAVTALVLLLLLRDFFSIYLFIGVMAVSCLVASAIRVAEQWEKVVIVRFGKFSRIAGPGLYFKIPIIEHEAMHIDQRIDALAFSAEETLTADLVPVDVDAVVFWMVWDPKKAYTEVRDYPTAVSWSAQTALRDAIGRINLADVAACRKQIDAGLKETLDEKISPWGITVVSVEIRNILIPESLQEALSKEAQAERERNARVIIAEVEQEISEIYAEASRAYHDNQEAMNLRTMNLVYESVKEGGSLVIAPSSFGDGLSSLNKPFNPESSAAHAAS